MDAVTLRPLAAHDCLDELTALLHRAYAPLGAAGMNFTAVDQPVATTRERVRRGQCVVALQRGRLVGTVTVDGMFDPDLHRWARQTPWFFRADVAHLHQYAVDPALQGTGVGGRLLAACEQWAREQGHRALALDTALPATHLRQRYQRAGFADVAQVQWGGKTYASTIMVKTLAEAGPAPHTDDGEHRAAIVRALWACVAARDEAATRPWLTDPAAGLLREHLQGSEPRSVQVHDVAVRHDGEVHSDVTVRQGSRPVRWRSRWRFDQGRVCALHDTRVEPGEAA
ncbi:MAG: GNAT family N-acetyltransferase [Burkholderiales bacterium]|nr:GNAT family N-acetyltransferase [Burkholderiales bacterium]